MEDPWPWLTLSPQAELEGTSKPLDDHLDDDDEDSNSATPQSSRPPSTKPEESEGGLKQFPDGSVLNARLRRLVTSCQREYKKEEARQVAKDKRNERRERIEQVIREREKQKTEQQQRKWSRREEQNFLRTVMAYGVEYSAKEGRHVWDRYELHIGTRRRILTNNKYLQKCVKIWFQL
jgi:hypothetical protein